MFSGPPLCRECRQPVQETSNAVSFFVCGVLKHALRGVRHRLPDCIRNVPSPHGVVGSLEKTCSSKFGEGKVKVFIFLISCLVCLSKRLLLSALEGRNCRPRLVLQIKVCTTERFFCAITYALNRKNPTVDRNFEQQFTPCL